MSQSKTRRAWVDGALIEGLALIVATVGAFWLLSQWDQQRHRGRAETLAELLRASHTPRMIASPGVEAWLLGLLHAAANELPADQRGAYDSLLSNGDGPGLAPDMAAVAERLRETPTSAAYTDASYGDRLPFPTRGSDVKALREVRTLVVGKGEDKCEVVVTRRLTLVETSGEPRSDLVLAARSLCSIAARWDEDPPTLAGAEPLVHGAPQRMRIYTILEDGSHLSLPDASASDPAQALARESERLQARPGSPSLASNSLFALFNYGGDFATQAHFTGIYPDLAGAGFVISVAVPVRFGDSALAAVTAIDLAVNVDFSRVLEIAEPALELELTGRLERGDSPMWQPWSAIASALPPEAKASLRREVQRQANREAEESAEVPQAPVAHHRTEDGQGSLFAIQVKEERWLIGWIDVEDDPLPWLPAAPTPVLVLGLVIWSRRRRRGLERERDAAERALEQRNAVLDLLELPLVVVDPNDDTVVECNAAAVELGVVEGRVFREHVIAASPDDQRYYKSQQVHGGRRRAYGVHVRVGAEDSDPKRPRFALIRSVSLSEPAPALGASVNQRLGLICVVDEDADLALYLEQVRADTRQDERNKLAALINHGADTLARVLTRQLAPAPGEDPTFARWLADYLLRRLQVSQWVLDHWDGPVETKTKIILGPEQLHDAVEQHERIFALIGDHADLRTQLHWNNGSLAAPSRDGVVIQTRIDWPKDYRLTTPADGVFGYLLGEALVNAIKHGVPGIPIELEADLDRSRRELVLKVRNHLAEGWAPSEGKAYGGQKIIDELARLCGWELRHEVEAGTFVLRCSCPVTLQLESGQVD